MPTTSGSYIAIASLLVAGLNYFGIVVPQNSAVEIIMGIAALIGVIKQLMDHKAVVAQARMAGAYIK